MAKEPKLTLEPCRAGPIAASDNSGQSSGSGSSIDSSVASKTTATSSGNGHASSDGPVLSQVSPFVVGYLGITPCSVQGVVRVRYPPDKPVKARHLTVTLTGIVRTKWTTRTLEPADAVASSNDGKVVREHGGLRGSLEAKLSGVGKSDGKSTGHDRKTSSGVAHGHAAPGGDACGEMVEIVHTHQAEDVVLSLSQDLWRTTAGDGWGALGGEHAFPFYFSLPPDLPDSMETEFGSVRYVLSAVLERRGRMLNTAGRKVVDVPLAIHRATLSTLHELTRPRKWQSDPAWSASSGIAYEMSIPRATFGPGDALEAVVKVKLASPGNVQFLGASLGIKEYITYRANNIARTESTYVANVDIDDQGNATSSMGPARAAGAKDGGKKAKSNGAATGAASKPGGQSDRVNKDGTREIQRTICVRRDPGLRPSVTTRLISIRHKLKLKLKLAGEKEISVDCPSWLTSMTRTECQQLEDWLRSKADAAAMALRQYTDEIDPPKDGRARQRDRYRASNTYHLIPGVVRHAVYLQLADGIAGLPAHMTVKDASIALAMAARAASTHASGDANAEPHAYVHYSRPGAPQSGIPQYDAHQKNRRSLTFGEHERGHNYPASGAPGQRGTAAIIGRHNGNGNSNGNGNGNNHQADDPARRYSMPVLTNDASDARLVGASSPMSFYGPNPYYPPYSPYGAPPPPATAGPPPVYYPYGHMPSPGAPYGYGAASAGQMPEPRPVPSEPTAQAALTKQSSNEAPPSSATTATARTEPDEQPSASTDEPATGKHGWRDIHDRPKSKTSTAASAPKEEDDAPPTVPTRLTNAEDGPS
ncbi:hypothetical protein SYNPS1DRAFT_27408 [Syncephalis pseudoplumigaleata]|uniref:Arrestin C-terminal-like domain-containing protein n=1 Tax=Syncephalis pseudoplumigaleata TaxID=1712513 RepID=A0A4P9Z319_9FUNG|nr:hypothetical protein SYNPS1DRAFT_27408 [Syncephalis pseudoplumigaleata]|eukprot:RKP26914.1 hypothetical protein SYNPS1DRAFT_27408 [Syncephalis pseudoplumigaleata]